MTFLQDHKFAFYHLFTFQYLGFDVCWVNSSHFHSGSCFTVGWCIYLLTISKCQYFQTLISVYCHFIKIIYWWHWCNKTLICCVFFGPCVGQDLLSIRRVLLAQYSAFSVTASQLYSNSLSCLAILSTGISRWIKFNKRVISETKFLKNKHHL